MHRGGVCDIVQPVWIFQDGVVRLVMHNISADQRRSVKPASMKAVFTEHIYENYEIFIHGYFAKLYPNIQNSKFCGVVCLLTHLDNI